MPPKTRRTRAAAAAEKETEPAEAPEEERTGEEANGQEPDAEGSAPAAADADAGPAAADADADDAADVKTGAEAGASNAGAPAEEFPAPVGEPENAEAADAAAEPTSTEDAGGAEGVDAQGAAAADGDDAEMATGVAEAVGSDAAAAATSDAIDVEAAAPDARAPAEAPASDDPDDPLAQPPSGTELFIGNIPHECDKEAIQAFCERVGPVHHLHVPPAKVPGAQNPGYAFAMYKSRIVAAEAIEQLAGQSVLPSNPRPLTVKYGSKQRHKLYVCNVPRTMPRQTLLETFRGLVRGVVELDVTTQKDQGRPEENRGFCFIEMYNQAAAEAAMPVLTSPDLVFAGERLQPPLRVEWAEGKQDGDQSGVKSLHLANLPDDVTEEKLHAAFSAYGGAIERIAMPETRPGETRKRNFAFVHFDKRSTALRVLDQTHEEPVVIDGQQLHVATAKPLIGRDGGGAGPSDRYPRGGPPGRGGGFGNYGGGGGGPMGRGGYDDYGGPPRGMGRGPRDRDYGDPYYDRRGPPPRERDRGGGYGGGGGYGPPAMGPDPGYGYGPPPDAWGGMAPGPMPGPYGMGAAMMGGGMMGMGGMGRPSPPEDRPAPSTGGYGTAARPGGQGGPSTATGGYGSSGYGGSTDGYGGAAPQRGYGQQRYGPY